jgi:hypothetical protein
VSKKLGLYIVAVLFVIYAAVLFTADAIDLSTADLGRHIQNGNIFFEALKYNRFDIFDRLWHTNFYSYTMPQAPFTNHHWFIGVIFSFLYKLLGFNGLTIFNIVCILLANLIMFFAARLISNTQIAFLSLCLLLPLTCMRTEVRPESISYIFFAVEFLLLALYKKEKISFKALLLPYLLIQLIWINMHIFFVFGIFLLVAFFPKNFFKIFIPVILISLINPSHIFGLLIPLNIFHDYGYMIAENQSVFFMQGRYPYNPHYYLLEIISLANLIVMYFLWRNKNLDYRYLIVSVILMILAFKTNRTIPLYALALVGVFAANLFKLKLKNCHWLTLVSILLLISWIGFYIGLVKRDISKCLFDPKTHASAEFFLSNNIKGPIFNNYDIGGYLIFHLFPKHRVFIDNRPEAYTKEFLQNIYVASLKDEQVWQNLEAKIPFNVIYFMRLDNTEHGQPFLIKRLNDSSWVPVFVDSTNIILLKNNQSNQELIKRYRLPASMFKVVK